MSTLEANPLQLERHFFSQIQFEALPEWEKDAKISLGAEVIEGRRWDEGVPRFRIVVDVTFGPGDGSKAGYRGKVQAVGYFGASKGGSLERAEEMVGTEGVYLLFDAVRELVCNLTARGPWPMLRLPRVTFTEEAVGPQASPSRKKVPPVASRPKYRKPSPKVR